MIKDVVKHPLFWIFFLAKAFLFLTWPSNLVTDLFVPFLDHAILNPGLNPWADLPARHFPYGSVLFVILLVPKFIFYTLFGDAALGNTLLSFAAVRLPILVADVLFFLLLFRFPGHRDKEWLYIHYWVNPVLIFINYAHGQLDIFAVFFVLLAIYAIKSKRETLSAFIFACAVLCKFHVVILAPLFVVYFWRTKYKDEAVPFLLKWTLLAGSFIAIGFLPHLLSSNLGYISVASPEAMKIFALSFTLDGQNQIYIGVGIVVAILARLILSSRMTEQGLLYSCGMVLGLLLVTTSSAPGWYYWLYPFIALFISQYLPRLQNVVIASYGFYLIYFFPAHLGYSLRPPFSSLAFTILQMSLIGILVAIWHFVIRFEMPLFRRSRPLLIGIAGDSGAGKNTLSKTFSDLFGQEATSLVEGDDYHKWERDAEKWQDYTHLNPRANYLEALTRNVTMLTQGRAVSQSQYDHAAGRFTDERLTPSQNNIIVQGLHALYPIALRRMMDIKIFVSPHEELRLFWKLKRDHGERGHSLDKVLASVEARRKDASTHIAPQKVFSDWVIEYVPIDQDTFRAKEAPLNFEPQVFQVHRLLNDTPLDALLHALKNIPTLKISCENDNENMDFIKLQVQGEISAQSVGEIASTVFGSVRQLTRSSARPQWQANLDGINQLVFLAMVQRAETIS